MESIPVLITVCIFLLLNSIAAAPSEGSLGQSKLEQLEAVISHLTAEVNGLTRTVQTLDAKMTTNIAIQYADKTIQSIITNHQNEATQFWLEMLNHAKQIRPDELLSKIVQASYSGSRSNFYPLLEFVIKNNISSAFPLIYKELESHGHLFGGQEVFVLAHYLKVTCGSNTRLFRSLPPVVQNIVSGPVIFQNEDNQGYIIAAQHKPCKDKTECYANPKNEAFLYRIFSSSSSPPAEVVENQRSHWQFLPPITMDMKNGFNGTRMSWGFHIKNIAEDRFLIAKMRLTAFFLRDNTAFDSYYVRDMQCQYMPTLVNVDSGQGKGSRIMIGLKEKHVLRMEYIFGNKFYKNDNKTPLFTRNHSDQQGKVWNVIPVNDVTSHSEEIDENRIDTDEVTLRADVSDSKCQF